MKVALDVDNLDVAVLICWFLSSLKYKLLLDIYQIDLMDDQWLT